MANKIEMGKQYQTRDGQEVRVLATDRNYKPFPVVFLVKDNITGEDIIYTADEFGKSSGSRRNDLVEMPLKIEGFINIYKGSTKSYEYQFNSTRQQADKRAGGYKDRIACLPITFIEGEGLEDAGK